MSRIIAITDETVTSTGALEVEAITNADTKYCIIVNGDINPRKFLGLDRDGVKAIMHEHHLSGGLTHEKPVPLKEMADILGFGEGDLDQLLA